MILYSIAKLWRLMKKCYIQVEERFRKVRSILGGRPDPTEEAPLPLARAQPTAVILVGKRRRAGMRMLAWVQRQFPDRFRNFIFVGVGKVDAQNDEDQAEMRKLQETIESSLRHYTRYCHRHGLAAEYRVVFGVNPMTEFMKVTQRVKEEYPRAMCFAGEVTFWQANSSPGRGPR